MERYLKTKKDTPKAPDIVNNLWYNEDNKWILSEVRVRNSIEILDHTELRIVDCKTGKFVTDDIGEVWDYEWKLITDDKE